MKESVEPATAADLGLGQRPELPSSQRVDYDNWTLPPYNRWSFQRVQQFTRTARVSRSPDVSPLSENMQELGEINFEDSQGLDTTVNDMLQRTWTDGFIVLHCGSIVTEKYFNDMRADTLHLMMSCSKSMTACLLGIAIDEGYLARADFLTQYIPELANTGMDGASIQQALDMRVGLQFEENYDDLNGEWRNLEIATGWREPPADYRGPRDLVGYLKTLTESAGPHGGPFHYQSILADVLGVCLERATQRTFMDLFAEKIWHPLGTEQELVTIVDAAGTAIFEGGFNCCLRDFARFGQMVCERGIAHGKQLIPEGWIDDSRFAGAELRAAFVQSEYSSEMPDYAYHNQWWLRDPQRGVIQALGIHGQMLFIDPDRDFVVAKFSSQPSHEDTNMELDSALACDAILEALESTGS